jgi:hypothetical protein
MLQKTTTFGLLGVLAAGSGAVLQTGEGFAPDGPETAARVARPAPAGPRIAPRVAPLDGLGTAAWFQAAPAPGGGGGRIATHERDLVDVAVDEAIRGLVTPGLQAGAGSFARFGDWTGGDVILRVLNDRADAAIACREPSAGERRRGLGEEHLGDLILVLVAHPENPVASLPSATLRDLMRGGVRDWGPVGGRPGAIRLVLPPPGPQADLYARVLARGDQLSTGAVLAAGEEERIRIVLGDRSALTVVSLEAARRMQAATMRIDGVPPSLGALRTGRYPLGSPVVLVHRGSSGADVLLRALRGPAARQALSAHLTLDP